MLNFEVPSVTSCASVIFFFFWLFLLLLWNSKRLAEKISRYPNANDNEAMRDRDTLMILSDLTYQKAEFDESIFMHGYEALWSNFTSQFHFL